ncbi:MAG: S8 family peptidase [Vulcanimicrobiaceae bacterium]
MKPALRVSLGILVAVTLSLPACGGGRGGGGGSIPAPASQGSTATQGAYACPSSDGTSSVATGRASNETATRRAPVRTAPATAGTASGRIAVTYDRAAYGRSAAAFAAREQTAGATLVHSFDYAALGKTVRVLSVPPSQTASAIAALRNQSGVLSVASTGERRFALTAFANLVNNHYFDGFAPANTPPYYEAAAVPGQWDMHAILLEHAFGYPGALGSHNVKLAVIDTGEDTLHPALGANVVYQKCFITNTSGVQSVGSFSTDQDGHGTDVAGIAAAVTNPSSGLGFAGAGGNTAIMAYRVFPVPDDNCTSPSSNDSQCAADTNDIASAIDDAVQNGASIISLSLGAGSCVTPGPSNPGGDSDLVEGTAIENAIAHNVIVVAASGNSNSSNLDAPGCDTGVIAVGATSLDDGSANGTGHSGGTPAAPVEYVAGYSNYGSPASSAGCSGAGCSSAWGIVAPGGDPANSSDSDDLHWIENIWTSTPFDSNFAGTCTPDFGTTSVADCRILIAGTSQATPHVAGVAALVCALNAADCTPTAMKRLLCGTAHDIGDPHEGCGRLDAYLAVATAVNDPSPPAR